MPSFLVTGPTATQNSPFLPSAVAKTNASTRCTLRIRNDLYCVGWGR